MKHQYIEKKGIFKKKVKFTRIIPEEHFTLQNNYLFLSLDATKESSTKRKGTLFFSLQI